MRIRVLLLASVLCGVAAAHPARRARVKAPKAQVTQEGDLEKIVADEPEGSVGYLYTPHSLAKGEKGGLFVMLHGHGGTPKGVVLRPLAERRKWLFLSVQGGKSIQTPQGPGFQWSTPDVERILALTRWVVENRPVDAERIVLIGFSAGGTMSLETYPKDPGLFRGILTCSSPMVPDSREKTTRVAVFLGTKDPNFANAASVRRLFEKGRVPGTFYVVDGGEHNDLPKPVYLDLATGWILAEKARGLEAKLPLKPPAEVDSPYRWLVVSFTGAKGAPADLRRRKGSAKALAYHIERYCAAGRAYFPHEAQAESSDSETAPVGGRVALDTILAAGVDKEKLEKDLVHAHDGAPAGPYETPRGYVLVTKDS